MGTIHRRLFWKIYLTLLSSLVIVAVMMGALWWVLGETPQERWGAFRIHLTDKLLNARDAGVGDVDEVIRRLGDEIGADISLYGQNGALLAARGEPLTSPTASPDPNPRPHMFMRVDLPGGRTMLVRLKPPHAERTLGILFIALVVAAGVGLAAFPMTARLTRQLEGLRSGMDRWGEGDLGARVDESGSDEVATVAHAFNAAADRITALLTSQRALLANASHELRSPLTRLRMMIDIWLAHPDGSGRDEIVRNLAELDHLVEEILLSSRLDHPGSTIGRPERVDLLGLAAEEAARVGAALDGAAVEIEGNEMLLRRLIRNLLENATTHGRPPVAVSVTRAEDEIRIVVSDDGKGIPVAERERVFEPFYRPLGHGEVTGGWGLGLALVRQIATRHGGQVACEGEPGRGSRFVVRLPGAGIDPGDRHLALPERGRDPGSGRTAAPALPA